MGIKTAAGARSAALGKRPLSSCGTTASCDGVGFKADRMSHNLTTDQIEHFREVFSVFDADGSGAIDGSELGSCLRALGQNLSEDELKELIMSVDDDGSGSIDFEEFLGMINSKTDAINCEDEMLAAFQEFDIARKGKLPRSTFMYILTEIGDPLKRQEVDQML